MTAIVIGGASGMGQALCVKVHTLDIDVHGLHTTKTMNSSISTHVIDICNIDSLRNFAKTFDRDSIRELYIVAGITCVDYIDGHNLDMFHKVMNVNFWGAVYATQVFLPKMTHGRIIFWGSVACFWNRSTRAAYTCSKKALETFVSTLRVKLCHRNFSCSCIMFLKIIIPAINNAASLNHASH